MSNHTDVELTEVVKKSKSYAGVLRQLGLRPAGGTHAHYRRRIQQLKLDTSHFTGQGWKLGGSDSKRLSPTKILVLGRLPGGQREAVRRLKRALLEIGRPWICVRCGNGTEWRGIDLALEIHHKNGDFSDNRSWNLDVCCPNCHQQIDRGL